MLERMRRVASGDRMTVEEFFQHAPEDRKAELVNGVFIMPSPASIPHEDLLGFLLTLLRAFVRLRGLGVVLGSRAALDLGVEYQAYEPDILFVKSERLHIVQEQRIVGAPDFIIEILSRGTKALDRTVKRRVYSQVGVDELWLPDPAGLRFSRFYQREVPGAELTEVKFHHRVLTSTTVPGFFVREGWLWPPKGQPLDEIAALRELGVIA